MFEEKDRVKRWSGEICPSPTTSCHQLSPKGGQPEGVGMPLGFSLRRKRAAGFIICLGCLIEMSGELVE